jgi:hypothetical protein
MKRTFVLGIVAGLAVAGLTLGGCDDGSKVTDGGVDTTGTDTTGTDTTGTDTTGTDTTGTDTTGDVSTDTPPTGDAQKFYRISSLGITTPGADQNTRFAMLMNTVLPIALSSDTLGAQLYLLVTFDNVTFGASGVVVTICQGDLNADGSLTCKADPAPVTTVGSIDNSGNLTTDPTDFAFAVDAQGMPISLTLANFTMNGLLEPTADNGPDVEPGVLNDGTFSAELPADDLCGITLSNPLLGSFCDQVTTINLLDLLDGPDMACGQDQSADTTACTASTDAATHNPPVDSGGELRFDTEGTFSLEGIVYTP